MNSSCNRFVRLLVLGISLSGVSATNAQQNNREAVDDIGASTWPSLAVETTAEAKADKAQSAKLNAAMVRFLEREFDATISAVVVRKESVQVLGTVPRDAGGYVLAELSPDGELYDGSGISLVGPVEKGGEFQFELPRLVPNHLDRLYSRFVLLKENGGSFEFASHLVWATDVAEIAGSRVDSERAPSIKGSDDFSPQTFAVTSELSNSGHIKTNIAINQLISSEQKGQKYSSKNQTIFINRPRLNALDERIAKAAELKRKVAAVILISRSDNDQAKSDLVHPDAVLGKYSMANLTTPKGVSTYIAVMEFLARRYNGTSAKTRGRINHWIIHNEVDAHRAWTHAGFKPLQLYKDLYVKSMRVAYYSVRRFDPVAQVFASFTHHWNSRPQKGHRDNFKPREMLDLMLTLSQAQGDFEWGIAFHPYPENLRNPATWGDEPKHTPFNFDARYITPRNIEVIDAYARRVTSLYNGVKVRPVLFSENGMSSNQRLNPMANEINQAAALAYFWMKVDGRLPSVEAIHYHRLVDHPREGGLAFGLLTSGSDDGVAHGRKKPSWDVWDAAGTDRQEAVFAEYLPITGLQDWSDSFVDMPAEVTPYHVRLGVDIEKWDRSTKVFVSFAGQRRCLKMSGEMNFHGVASNVAQPLSVSIDGRVLSVPPLDVSADSRIDISVSRHGEMTYSLKPLESTKGDRA